MGTRGLSGFKYEGKHKVMYNQFDSYPDGLGHWVAEFVQLVQKEKGWDVLKENVANLEVVDEGDKPTKKQQEKYACYADTRVSSRSLDEWYVLMRKLQGDKILHEVYKGKVGHIPDARKFIEDSLFCEYAYIVNLDTMCLDCYNGGRNKIASIPFKEVNTDAIDKAYGPEDEWE